MQLATEQIFLAIIFIIAVIGVIIALVLFSPTIRALVFGLGRAICEKLIPGFILSPLRFFNIAPC